ncbi:hypothetical protein CIY_02190 [Butyrivibrio fibrisolvens 16/4]|nr:hypothetical protein CIY_02190 [Butyrivibrio fibrisolvens 16/4]
MKKNWSKLYLKIMVMLMVAFMVYGAIVTFVVYRNVLEENYHSIESMLDTGAENINRTFEMMDGTTIALSGSESISKWRNKKHILVPKIKVALCIPKVLTRKCREYLFITMYGILTFLTI